MNKVPVIERPGGCSCTRWALLKGTCSSHCNVCPWSGYETEINDRHDFDRKPVAEVVAWIPGEPRVVCAALKDANGRIVTGARHFDGVMMEQIKRGPWVDDWRGADQGFIDQKGNYLTREEAHVIASRHGQILRRVGSDDMSLFSENLY